MHGGREAKVTGARIAGLVSCLPREQVDNAGFAERFGQAAVDEVVKMIGVQSRRRVAPARATCAAPPGRACSRAWTGRWTRSTQ